MRSISDKLNWRVEMAVRAAWPSAKAINISGWQARQGGRPIRRVNSLNPLPGAAPPDAALLSAAIHSYRQISQPALIRLLDFLPVDDALFEREGFAPEGDTLTLHADLVRTEPDRGLTPDLAVDLTAAPGADWLAARVRIGGSDADRFQSMLSMIHDPAAFAAIRHQGEIAALAYGVIHGGLLIVESVMTAEAARGQGLARKVVSALMQWAGAQGVGDAALQVVADNAAARALYQRLGFENRLYGYRYIRCVL